MRTISRPTAVVVGLALVAGCGVQEYESRMHARLIELRKITAFDSLDRAGPVVEGSAYTIRLPKPMNRAEVFDRAAKTAAGKTPSPKDADDSQKVSSTTDADAETTADDELPDFLREWPGPVRMGTRNDRADNRNIGTYFYLAVMPKGRQAAHEIAAAILQSVRKQWPGIEGAWSEVTCETPEGAPLAYQRLRATGRMVFARYAAAGSTAGRIPGKLELYLHDAGRDVVLWGVRVTEQVDQETHLAYLAEASAGTLVVAEAHAGADEPAAKSKRPVESTP